MSKTSEEPQERVAELLKEHEDLFSPEEIQALLKGVGIEVGDEHSAAERLQKHEFTGRGVDWHTFAEELERLIESRRLKA